MSKSSYNFNEDKKVPYLTSCRYLLALFGFGGGICLYLMRINMSVAIVCMTIDEESRGNGTTSNSTSVLDVDEALWFRQEDGMWMRMGEDASEDSHSIWVQNEDDDRCNKDTGGGSTGKQTGEFIWSRQIRGNINSAFFVGYILTQVLGGWLAGSFGAKWVIAIGMGMSTLMTMLSPVAARGSPVALMVVRAISGLGQGVFFPAFHSMWGRWAPPYERSKLVTFVLAGNSWGNVLNFIISGILCESNIFGGWPSIFYIYGIVAGVWCIGWIGLVHSSPAEHPRISVEEREYIESALGQSQPAPKSLKVPWLKALTSPCCWAIFIAQFCNAWGGYTNLTSLTQYMKDVLKFDMKSNGFFQALPYVCNWLATVSIAPVADYLISKQIFRIVTVRKGIQTIAFLLPAACIIACGFVSCEQAAIAITLLCFMQAFTAGSRSGIITNMLDICPRYGGLLMGIGNTFGTVPGIVAPIVVGRLVPNGEQSEWRTVFFISGGVMVFGWVVYMIFGRGEVQKWAKSTDDGIELEVADKKDMNENEGFNNHGYVGSLPTISQHLSDKKDTERL